MYRKPSRIKAGTARFCSHRCHWKAERPVPLTHWDSSMEKNPAWKGGVTLKRAKGNYRGVRYVRAPQWARPMARADGYIMEHRLVMAEWMGRLMARSEVVNHENHDPSDNRRENLTLWPSNGDHKRGETGRIVPGVANRYRPEGLALR
jgi:hypothetical protein